MVIQTVDGQMAARKETFSRYMFDQVHITGKTNVNDFHMEYREDEFCRMPSTFSSDEATIEINIPAEEVEADSKIMLKDFLDLINSDEYPNITIEIAKDEIDFASPDTEGKKTIELSMNGLTKKYQCETVSASCFVDQWCLTGQLKLKLTDFNIEPPHKFLGLVKVRNEIFISFRILFS
jgi:hypothetical protein